MYVLMNLLLRSEHFSWLSGKLSFGHGVCKHYVAVNRYISTCCDFRKYSMKNSDNVSALEICHTGFLIVHACMCEYSWLGTLSFH